jgi:hypothetical protein
MTRNPCKVPTDVRKVKAVKHAELSELVDVIVCSVQGERRLLDFLAGGEFHPSFIDLASFMCAQAITTATRPS